MAGSLGIELTEDAKKLVEDHIEGGKNWNESTNPTVVTGANENKNEDRKEVGSMAGPNGYIKNDYGTFEEATGIFTFKDGVKEINNNMVNVNGILKSVERDNVKGLVGNSVETIGGGAFSGFRALTKAEFNGATKIGNYAFSGCEVLKEVNFEAATTIGDWAFLNCRSLTTVNIPKATTIGKQAFSGCTGLTKAEFPNATSIGERAFEGCKTLNKVDIPNMETIDESVFSGCPILEELNKKADEDVPPPPEEEDVPPPPEEEDVPPPPEEEDVPPPPEMSEEEKGNELQWQDNVAYKANGSNFVPLTPLSTVETTIVFPEDQVKKFNNQVDEFNKLVGEIETFKSANKDKIKQVIGDTNLGWTEYSNTAWVNDKKSDFTSNTNNYTDMVGRTDPKNSKLNQFYEVMLNYLPYQNKEEHKKNYSNLDPERKLNYIDVVIDNIKKTFESLKEEVKNLSTGQDENKKNETLASQTDGGMKPPSFQAPNPSEYEKMNELKEKLKNLNDKYNGLVKDNGAFFARYLSKDTKDSSGVQKSYDIVQSASEVKGFLGALRAYISNILIPLGDARTAKFFADAEAITDSKVDANKKMTKMYELAARAVYRLEKNIAKQKKIDDEAKKENDDLKNKNKLGKAIYKAKKVGRKAGKKLDKFLGTDHVFHSKKNKDEGDKSAKQAKQAKLVKKCFKNAANYIVKFKLGSFKRKELNKAFNGLTKEFSGWKDALQKYFGSDNPISNFALEEDKKKDYKKASVAVLLASLCGLPNTECIISACEGLKEGGLRGNFKGRDYLNDAVKIRKDVKTKAIAGGKESVKSYLLSYVKLNSLINYNTNSIKKVVNEFSNIKYDESDEQGGNEAGGGSAPSTVAGGESTPAEKKKGLKDKISGGVKTVGKAASSAGNTVKDAAVFAAGKVKKLFKKSSKNAGNIDTEG